MSRIVGFDPIVHGNDRILILGSMPSVESLHQSMYYANRTNRFWPMISSLYSVKTQTEEEKLEALKVAKIALWDICHSCIRNGSSDSNIKEVVQNDIPSLLLANPSIQKILCNGKTSYQYLKKFYPELLDKTVVLPSTSAANAKFRLDDLMKVYKKEILDE